jgi:predicted Rdx family selenoprotein
MDNPELKEVLNQTVTKTLWDRRQDGGFPETKELKRRVRDVIEPGRNLGHVDRDAKTGSHERGTCGEPCKECE